MQRRSGCFERAQESMNSPPSRGGLDLVATVFKVDLDVGGTEVYDAGLQLAARKNR